MKPQALKRAVGQDLPPLKKPEITHTQLVQYAGASGDFNPIHTVVPIAEKAGLGGVIAHGMLIMGFAGEAICNWFPRRNLRRFKVRFAAMTRPGEEITITGKIVEPLQIGEKTGFRCELVAYSQTGETKLKGEFEVTGEEISQ